MPSSSTYPSIPVPQNTIDSVYQSVLSIRQTVQLLIVNSQQITNQTLTQASQIFSKKTDSADVVSTVNNNLTTVNKAISNVSQAIGALQTSVTTLQGQVSALTSRVTSLENRMGIAERNIVDLDNAVGDLDSRVSIIEAMTTHDVRVRAASSTLNNAVANGGFLQFDTIDFDTSGYAPVTSPFNTITIPTGLDGIYMLVAAASGTGNQSTSIGMGVLITGAQKYSETNQTIYGPGSVSYILDTDAIEILHLVGGDTIQLVNNSVSSGTNAFTALTLALVRIEVP